MKYLLCFLAILGGFLFVGVAPAQAQVCYPQRVINQYRCQGSDPVLDCTGGYRSEQIGTGCYGEGSTAGNAKTACVTNCQNPYPAYICADGYCLSWAQGTATNCTLEDKYVGCTAAPDCKAVTDVVSCAYLNSVCTDTTQTLVYGCWSGVAPTSTPAPPPVPVLCGLGGCNVGAGETCGNCPVDCGACPPPPPACGDGTCDTWETCSSCSADCGTCITPPPCNPNDWGTGWSTCSVSCGSGTLSRTNQCGDTQTLPCCVECGPTTGAFGSCSGSPATKTRPITYNCQADTTETLSCTGTIQARAVEVTSADTSCTAVRASTTGVSPAAIHRFTAGSASQPGFQIQTGDTYVTFADVVGGTYTIAPTVSASYVLKAACWSRTLNALTTGEGLTTTLSEPLDSETLTWDLGYTLGTPWVQTGGGDVYAAGSVTSAVAALTSPRSFSLNGTGGYPGLVRYGTSYDFDSDVTSKGETFVSSPKWLAQETDTSVNYYDYFRIKLGGTFPADYTNPLTPIPKPTSRATPYFVSGDMTTSGDWVVGNGETILFIVNGNLTLGGKVNLVGSGFAAFIVNGNITISSSVGGLYTSSAPVIEGMYITKPTGSFKTGTSTVVGKERLVLQGMFMAGGFTLERDLASVNANTTTSSELFLYNPRLLFSMPDSMRDVPITWEEVAP